MEAQMEAATSSALLFLYGSKPIDRLPGQEAAWATAPPRCHPTPVRSTRCSTGIPGVDKRLAILGAHPECLLNQIPVLGFNAEELADELAAVAQLTHQLEKVCSP
jgi:hypothetical protein